MNEKDDIIRILKFPIKYWDNISDYWYISVEYPSVTLSNGSYFGMTCEVTPDGIIKINTSSGGGHGEGTFEDAGRSANEWVDLIKEAEAVRLYYFG